MHEPDTASRQQSDNARREATRAKMIVGGLLAVVIIGGWLLLSYLP